MGVTSGSSRPAQGQVLLPPHPSSCGSKTPLSPPRHLTYTPGACSGWALHRAQTPEHGCGQTCEPLLLSP